LSTSTNKKLALSQCVEGMLFYKRASGKSPSTIADYRNSFDKLQTFFAKNPPDAPRVQPPVIETFGKEQIEALLKGCDRSARRPSFAISGLAQSDRAPCVI